MARAIEQIERDIAMLEVTLSALSTEIKSGYDSYLINLGKAVQQQLMLASYHLCTQGYPEAFLNLSFDRRQQLQQDLRKLGYLAAQQLQNVTKVQPEYSRINKNQHNHRETTADELISLDYLKKPQPEEHVPPPISTFLREEKRMEAFMRGEKYEPETFDEDEGIKAHLSFADKPAPKIFVSLSASPDSSNPISLMLWQQYIEGAIAQILKQVSRETNKLLQAAKILPKKLPEPVIEAATASSEAVAESLPGPPNLLNLVIEVENQEKSEESAITQLMAINLRLVEIEFADATLSTSRQQLRSLLVKLNKIGKQYQKYHRELSIAEAESAWRASWVEDES
ncbi:MAG: hypothetical protein VKL59_00215 [Nostocaceae cyanobacterium]|nr:hypothetical protein [Nostocaceae cyanobacterium]